MIAGSTWRKCLLLCRGYVVAEGIETLDQLALLYQLGCEKGQGFFFGRPAPAEELFRH